ncbi:MAG TPA: hypothetical protein VL475_13815 [Planctomycetaceae bacterium]|nr:hypothetical protein [Planctomycetaceae bacterium]
MAKFRGENVDVLGLKLAVRYTRTGDKVECRLLEQQTGGTRLGRVVGFGSGADEKGAIAKAVADCRERARKTNSPGKPS